MYRGSIASHLAWRGVVGQTFPKAQGLGEDLSAQKHLDRTVGVVGDVIYKKGTLGFDLQPCGDGVY